MTPTQLLGIVLIAPLVIGVIIFMIQAWQDSVGRFLVKLILFAVSALIGLALLLGGK